MGGDFIYFVVTVLKEDMFTDFMDEDNLRIAIRNLANDFLVTHFNMNVTSDFNLEFKIELYLCENKMNVKLAREIAQEILKHQQSRVNYGFEN